MKKLIIWISCIVILLAGLGGAAYHLLQDAGEEEGYRLYFLSQEEDQLVPVLHEAEESDPSALAAELYILQQTLPQDRQDELKLLLPDTVTLLNLTLEEDQLHLNFSSGYADLSAEREILVRAGMVRLFTQIPEVKKVQFQIEGNPLTNSDGVEIGLMTAGKFVENSGKEINSYLKTTLTLYFANEDGTLLVPEVRSVYYNSNVPLERVVVEQLISGPKEEGHYTVLPSELNILSVTIQDGICYVNLDDSFVSLLNNPSNTLNEELAVYSVVSSITETCKADRIQISINGNTNVEVGSVDLSNLLTLRQDLIFHEEENDAENETEAQDETAMKGSSE
ncbi:MAG: GerMN domain-containing protein [Lachnospiraceae bacterium]|nr:GerMN domain-containing protein [Lachnospiraceae bacterium]